MVMAERRLMVRGQWFVRKAWAFVPLTTTHRRSRS